MRFIVYIAISRRRCIPFMLFRAVIGVHGEAGAPVTISFGRYSIADPGEPGGAGAEQVLAVQVLLGLDDPRRGCGAACRGDAEIAVKAGPGGDHPRSSARFAAVSLAARTFSGEAAGYKAPK
jgi:hypothetical protein